MVDGVQDVKDLRVMVGILESNVLNRHIFNFQKKVWTGGFGKVFCCFQRKAQRSKVLGVGTMKVEQMQEMTFLHLKSNVKKTGRFGKGEVMPWMRL